MKKFFLFLIAIIVILLVAAYAALFSDAGNKLVANYAQKQIDSQLAGLKITDFKLRPNSLDMKLDYLNMIEAKVGGELSLASLSLNLLYTIDSKNLELINIKEQIHASGHIVGKYNDLAIDAKGDLLGSKLDASAKLADFNPVAMKLNLDRADVGKILSIAKLPIANGELSASIDAASLSDLSGNIKGWLHFLPAADAMSGLQLSSLDKLNINAMANSKNDITTGQISILGKIININLKDIKLQNQALSATLHAGSKNIAWILPELNTDLNANLALNFKDKILSAKGIINGANISAQNIDASFNTNTQDLAAKADVSANAALLRLPKSQLANVQINTQLKAGKLDNLSANGIVLGGNLQAKLAEGRLSANIKHASLDQAILLADAPMIANGHFDAEANFTKLSTLTGKLNATLSAATNPTYFKAQTGYSVATPVGAKLNVDMQGEQNINFNMDAQSKLIDNLTINGKLADKKLNAKFTSNAKLENFNALLNKKMQGPLALNGELNASYNELLATINSTDFFGAKLTAQLKNSYFDGHIEGADIPRFAKAFDFADIYSATANASIQYDLKSARGKIHADLAQGHLQPHPVLKLIDAVSGSSVDKIIFNKGQFDSNIAANIASIDAQLDAANAQFVATSGQYNLASKQLNAPVSLRLNTTTIKGSLAGTDGKVKFIPNAENTVENVLNLVDKLSHKERPAAPANEAAPEQPAKPDLSSKQGRQEAAKTLLKGLFK